MLKTARATACALVLMLTLAPASGLSLTDTGVPEDLTDLVTESICSQTELAPVCAEACATGATAGLLCYDSCIRECWVARYDGPGEAADTALAIQTSPDGARVYTVGASWGSGSSDYVVLALDVQTGTVAWTARYDGPAGGLDAAYAVALDSSGTRVFVTGESAGNGTGGDYTTIAYDANDGSQLWVSRYDGPISLVDTARAVVTSPDDSRVYVTGLSWGVGSGADYATIAYNASNGDTLWVSRYNGAVNGHDRAYSIAVSPDGSRILVTGESAGTRSDWATLAYDAGTGLQQWVRIVNGPGNSADIARKLVLSPDGSQVYVGGTFHGYGPGTDFGTVAYDAATGNEIWRAQYNNALSNGPDDIHGIAVNPAGTMVFVTGGSRGDGTGRDYATIAYATSDGAQQWLARFNGSPPGQAGEDIPSAIGVSPDGTAVFVTGVVAPNATSQHYATVAYEASLGAELWIAEYDAGFPGGTHAATALSVSPSGSRVFITGNSKSESTGAFDIATVAYNPSVSAS